jgi:hypothetical protein
MRNQLVGPYKRAPSGKRVLDRLGEGVIDTCVRVLDSSRELLKIGLRSVCRVAALTGRGAVDYLFHRSAGPPA